VIARDRGISETVVGLTIVVVTSLPELAAAPGIAASDLSL
jgi:Ca2+/Na+ antiporter